MNDYFEIRPT